MLFVSQEIRGQRQATPGQYRDHTLVPEGTDQAIERHRGNMADHRTQFQTEPAMRR